MTTEVVLKKFVVATFVGVIAIAAYGIFTSRTSPSSTITAVQVDAVGFGPEQNDTAGYGGFQWGTPLAKVLDTGSRTPDIKNSFVDTADKGDSQELAKVFNVPDTTQGGGILSYRDTDFSVVPDKFQTIAKTDCNYVFYNGQLVLVYVDLNAKEYDRILADLENKFQEMGSSKYGWTQHTLDDGDPDSTDLNVTLFKRGNTNTKVYLLQRIDHESGMGVKVSSLHVLYIPTPFMGEIQHDIEQISEAQMASAEAAAQHDAQPDLDKLQ